MKQDGLLNGLFPMDLKMHDDFYLRQSSWIALLSIAHRYEFQNVLKHVIREIFDRPARKRRKSDLEPGDPIPLISIAEKYDVPLQHIAPHLIALVMREEALTKVEVSLLSPLTLSRLGRAHEDFLRDRPSRIGGPKPLNCPVPTNGPVLMNGFVPVPMNGHVPLSGPATSCSPNIMARIIVDNIWLEVEE